jgi:SAM-dependent methyltransferase
MSPDAYLEMAETESRHWWFCGRRKILEHIIDRLDLPAHAKILEIGSGTGGNLKMLSSFGEVKAMEMDATARAIAYEKNGRAFDIRPGVCPFDMPFSGQKFDLVCLFDVLEHIQNDVETLVAIKPLLAKGGSVLLTVPAYQWLWSSHDVFLHHKRRYAASELKQKLEAAGLRAAKLTYFNTLLFPIVAAFRLKDRFFKKTNTSGTDIPCEPINRVLYSLFGSERFLLNRLSLPYGVSLLAVLKSEDQ